MRGVSQPPHDPRRPDQHDPYAAPGPYGQDCRQWDGRGAAPRPGQPYGDPRGQYGDAAGQQYADQRGQYADQRGQYGDPRGQHADAPGQQYGDPRGQARPPQAGVQRPQQPRPSQPSAPSRSRGRRFLGPGLVLAILGALVLLVSMTVLPWADGGQSLATLWDQVRDLPSMGFGDWYVLVAGAPLAVLGILLSFAAVLESVAMKVIWVALTVLGLGYVAFRYGIGPLTGVVGDTGGFSLVETAVAAGALVAIVVVLFVLKSAVGMFRRIAGLILLGLSGVHISALVDLVGANDLSALSAGAYGPAVGYLLAGAAAFVTPRRLVPGL